MFPIIGKSENTINEKKIVDQLRILGLDMINEAGNGHPGIVLGAAPIIYTLYAHHLVANPNDPAWINRDRFVLSAGHGSALLYATLFLGGFPLTIEDLKDFRQFGSKTPGHPELNEKIGVDLSTGPLGQGIASAVGLAIGEVYLRTFFKKKVIDHYTYVLCGDGDLMEGVSYEAASLAGTLGLNRLIVLYDSNKVSLDSKTDTTFTENIKDRFLSMNWNYILVEDGEDIRAIDKAISDAKQEDKRPTLIEVKTTIGKYSKNEGTPLVHGTPLDVEDISQIKEKLNFHDLPFAISKEAMEDFQKQIHERVDSVYKTWQSKKESLDEETLSLLTSLEKRDIDFKKINLTYEAPEDGMESTRDASGKVLQSIAESTPFFLGGSADLATSNKTYLKEFEDFTKDHPNGKNIRYGVREHAMAAISNGLSLCGLRPFASTFLVFMDYLKPALRMSALMNLPVIYILTHDSIAVGEDGPTHEPVEQLISLRATPNFEVFRPADANEVIGTYKTVLNKKDGPATIILGRNKVPIQPCTNVNEVDKGGYIVISEEQYLQGVIIATGEELALAIEARQILKDQGIDLRVVSMPSIERFRKQKQEYQESVLPPTIKTFVIEASSSYSWYSFVYNDKYLITVNSFGASGKRDDILKNYQMDIDSIVKKIKGTF